MLALHEVNCTICGNYTTYKIEPYMAPAECPNCGDTIRDKFKTEMNKRGKRTRVNLGKPTKMIHAHPEELPKHAKEIGVPRGGMTVCCEDCAHICNDCWWKQGRLNAEALWDRQDARHLYVA